MKEIPEKYGRELTLTRYKLESNISTKQLYIHPLQIQVLHYVRSGMALLGLIIVLDEKINLKNDPFKPKRIRKVIKK